jgi:hypothetical protein
MTSPPVSRHALADLAGGGVFSVAVWSALIFALRGLHA